NTGYVTMANQMNMCDIGKMAASMGLQRADGPTDDGEPLRYNTTFVIGTNELSPLRMAAAFATFAANGTYCEPRAILSIKDADDNELSVPDAACEDVLSPKVTAGVTHALQAVAGPGGTGSAPELPGRPTAGTTETRNNGDAAWFVGYIPQAYAAVWVRHSESQPSMFNSAINGRFYSQVFGGAIAAPICNDYM